MRCITIAALAVPLQALKVQDNWIAAQDQRAKKYDREEQWRSVARADPSEIAAAAAHKKSFDTIFAEIVGTEANVYRPGSIQAVVTPSASDYQINFTHTQDNRLYRTGRSVSYMEMHAFLESIGSGLRGAAFRYRHWVRNSRGADVMKRRAQEIQDVLNGLLVNRPELLQFAIDDYWTINHELRAHSTCKKFIQFLFGSRLKVRDDTKKKTFLMWVRQGSVPFTE